MRCNIVISTLLFLYPFTCNSYIITRPNTKKLGTQCNLKNLNEHYDVRKIKMLPRTTFDEKIREVGKNLETIWDFSRPHTIVGRYVSI